VVCGPIATVILLEIGASKHIRRAISERSERSTKRGANYSELPSTRAYPEDLDRLEVRVPTVGKPSKSEDSDTQGRRGAEYFTSEDFQRNCETVTLSVVLQQYSTSTQYRAAQSDKVRDVSKPQFLQYSSYWNRSFGVSAAIATSPKCLGNSVRSTGSTETVSATASQYWNYRTFDVQVQVQVHLQASVRRPF
jgi:hypothetical protein